MWKDGWTATKVFRLMQKLEPCKLPLSVFPPHVTWRLLLSRRAEAPQKLFLISFKDLTLVKCRVSGGGAVDESVSTAVPASRVLPKSCCLEQTRVMCSHGRSGKENETLCCVLGIYFDLYSILALWGFNQWWILFQSTLQGRLLSSITDLSPSLLSAASMSSVWEKVVQTGEAQAVTCFHSRGQINVPHKCWCYYQQHFFLIRNNCKWKAECVLASGSNKIFSKNIVSLSP